MTEEHDTTDPTAAAGEATMADVDHTHPHTGKPFGEPFRRGVVSITDRAPSASAVGAGRDTPEVRPDGGRTPRDEEREDEEDAADGTMAADRTMAADGTMAEVDHVGTDGVSRTFERGRVREDDTK